jgi:hypothetical protein
MLMTARSRLYNSLELCPPARRFFWEANMNRSKTVLVLLQLSLVSAIAVALSGENGSQSAQPTSTPDAQAGWTLSSLNSPMGDNSGMILHAKQLSGEHLADPTEGTGLKIQCSKKKGLEVILRTNLLLRDSGTINDEKHKGELGGMFSKHRDARLSPIRVRFDQQNIRSEEWVTGADSSNLFAQKPKAFVGDILKDQVKQVLLEAHPANGNPVVFKFDVTGLSNYRTQLHDACDY